MLPQGIVVAVYYKCRSNEVMSCNASPGYCCCCWSMSLMLKCCSNEVQMKLSYNVSPGYRCCCIL